MTTKPIPNISCDPESVMKWILILVLVLAFVVSFIADYQWRRWMDTRKGERQKAAVDDPTRRPDRL